MEYAIVQISGKQYTIREGEEVLVDRLSSPSETYEISEILLMRKDGTVHVGSPFVKDAVIKARVLGDIKGKKLHISKFKAKVRYDKTIGFRPIYSKLKIETITYGDALSKKQQEPDSDEKGKKVAVKKKAVKKVLRK